MINMRLYFTVHRSLLFSLDSKMSNGYGNCYLFTTEMKSEMSVSLTINMTRWGSALLWVDEFLSRSKIETIFQFNIQCYFISFEYGGAAFEKNSWMLRGLWEWTFIIRKYGFILTILSNDKFYYQQIHLEIQTSFIEILKRNSNENVFKWKTERKLSSVAEDWNRPIERSKSIFEKSACEKCKRIVHFFDF